MSGNCIYLNSIGIDIGTTTTQVIFSRLEVANTAPGQLASTMEIVRRQILYQGQIHFTPLRDPYTIDAQGVRGLVEEEFQKSGLNKDDIHTGAVIITGQSAKKQNAREIACLLADITGNFVVVTAGPHIEAFLAGKGSGAAERSKKKGSIVANVDIGGGTTNIAVFRDGSPIDSCCLNIGGRLLRISPEGTVTFVSAEARPFMDQLGLDIYQGKKVTVEQLRQLTGGLASALRKVFVEPGGEELKLLFTTGGLRLNYTVDEIIFSGGVADYIYQPGTPGSLGEICFYGDIGPLLGAAIRDSFSLPVIAAKPPETIRATVTGAGVQSLQLSGSTILVNQEVLPIKNIPVIKVMDLNDREGIVRTINTIVEESKPTGLALALGQISPVSFVNIYRVVKQVTGIIDELRDSDLPLILITENDCALVLGQTMGTVAADFGVMCIDQIAVDEGDYLDIGSPIEDKAVPVVIKTLLFG